MTTDVIAEITGAAELSNWFGGFPSFHDAPMELQISGDGTGWITVYGFRMTSEVDSEGHFILDQHFAATFQLSGIKSLSMADFLPGLAILVALEFRKVADMIEIDFSDTAYGLSGSIVCEKIVLTFEPGVKPP